MQDVIIHKIVNRVKIIHTYLGASVTTEKKCFDNMYDKMYLDFCLVLVNTLVLVLLFLSSKQ